MAARFVVATSSMRSGLFVSSARYLQGEMHEVGCQICCEFLSYHHRGVAAGILAILELYFVRFLFICLGMDAATSMGTTCVNIFIATFQLCAISAGLLADKVLGEL